MAKKQFEQLLERTLPPGWEQKATELKAFVRARKICSPAELIRMILIYLTCGKSFGITSVLMRLLGYADIKKVAVYKRMVKCGDWLKWLCGNIYRHAGYLAEKPAWLEGWNVVAVDASEDAKGGKACQYYMLHYCLDLFTLSVRELLVTTRKVGEKLSNFTLFKKGDLVMGDRVYSSIAGIEHLKGLLADFILRLRSNSFYLYVSPGQVLDLLSYLSGLKVGEDVDLQAFYLHNGKYKPVRVCARRKDGVKEEAGKRRLARENSRKQRGEVSEVQEGYNKYIIVVTSLGPEVSAMQILELYRLRWQIEIAFKRLKTLFGYDDLPMMQSTNAITWFYGKLLVAALCETLVNKGRAEAEKVSGEKSAALPCLSLWRELQTALSLLSPILLERLLEIDLWVLISRLSALCADSKRKRVPQLHSFGLRF